MPLQPAQSLSSELSGARIIGSQSTHGAAPLTPGCGCGCGCVHTTPTRMWVWMHIACVFGVFRRTLPYAPWGLSPPLPSPPTGCQVWAHQTRRAAHQIRCGPECPELSGQHPTTCSRILCPGNSSAHSVLYFYEH